MIGREKLVDGFEEFIRRESWGLIATLTFRQPISTTSAKKCLKCLFKHLNSKDRIYFAKYVICLVFFEREGIRDSVHVHLLIKGIAPCHARTLENYIMQKRCRRDRCVRDSCRMKHYKTVFGKSVVAAYDPKDLAKYYLANKYDTDALDDFDFLRINGRYRKGSRPYHGQGREGQTQYIPTEKVPSGKEWK